MQHQRPPPPDAAIRATEGISGIGIDVAGSTHMTTRILCLLPVRNGAEHLQAYFDNVRRFASGIVALDDGSTDQTLDLLHREALVLQVLRNPRRRSCAGWNDAENRQRLLDASAGHAPDWIVWLDADELIAEPDLPLLRTLISEIANPGHAYAFEVLRMIGDLTHFDQHRLWVYRLFGFQAGQRLPAARLHFQPIPDDISREHTHRTIIRILHKGGMTPQARRARFLKYREADPGKIWQATYANLLAGPGHLWSLRAHPKDAVIVIE